VALFWAQHRDHAEADWADLKFRAEFPPSTQDELQIHSFPDHIDPRSRNSRTSDQIALDKMSGRDDASTPKAISESIMKRNTLGNSHMTRADDRAASKMEERSPGCILCAARVYNVWLTPADDASEAQESLWPAPRANFFHMDPGGVSFQMCRKLAGFPAKDNHLYGPALSQRPLG
jgi:hypothetical protein